MDSEKENMACVGVVGSFDDEWIRWFETGTQTGWGLQRHGRRENKTRDERT